MKKHFLVLLSLLLLSCATSKDVLYFQDIDKIQKKQIQAEYITRIAKDDLLNIVVTGPDKTVVMPFNLTLTDNIAGSYSTSHALFPCHFDTLNLGQWQVGDVDIQNLVRR